MTEPLDHPISKYLNKDRTINDRGEIKQHIDQAFLDIMEHPLQQAWVVYDYMNFKITHVVRVKEGRDQLGHNRYGVIAGPLTSEDLFNEIADYVAEDEKYVVIYNDFKLGKPWRRLTSSDYDYFAFDYDIDDYSYYFKIRKKNAFLSHVAADDSDAEWYQLLLEDADTKFAEIVKREVERLEGYQRNIDSDISKNINTVEMEAV